MHLHINHFSFTFYMYICTCDMYTMNILYTVVNHSVFFIPTFIILL